jgi:hypothetical protein
VITDTQSYGLVIRDTLWAKTVTLPFFAGFKSRRCKQLQVVPEVLPYLGVYFMNESMTSDGDPNAGEVRFDNEMTLGFSVIIQNNDPVESETKLDQAYWAIMNGLWRDQYIMNLIDTSAPVGVVALPDGIVIEGIRGGKRKHVWGNAGLNNETPIAEMSYEANILYSTSFPPIITDDLLRWHQETVPLAHDGTIPPSEEVQRIISIYEFTPATGYVAAA